MTLRLIFAIAIFLCSHAGFCADVSGFVFSDDNGNGVRDDGEAAFSGWTVYVDANQNGVRNVGETTSVTDGSGAYSFTGLGSTQVRIAVEVQSSYSIIYPSKPLKKVGRLDTNTHDYGDVWGDGDLAAIGSYTNSGPVQLIDISDPTHPALIGNWEEEPEATVAKHASSSSGSQYEDVLIANGIGYFSSNNGLGVHIVDVSDPARADTIAHIDEGADASEPLDNVHTLSLGGDFLYLADNRTPKVYIFDVSDPANPTHVRTITTNAGDDGVRVHEVTVKNGRLYVAVNEGADEEVGNVEETEIWDVSDVADHATFLGSYDSGYNTHTVTVTDDGKYAISAREIYPWAGAIGDVTIWDISDPANAVKVSTLNAEPLGFGDVTCHIPMVVGNLLYVSWYWAGVQVFDIGDPTHPILVGGFDTSWAEGEFEGCWGVYPYLGSDRILASDIENGLFVLATGIAGGHYLALDLLGTVSGVNFAIKPGVAPTIASVTASPDTVTETTSELSVSASDDGGESALTYSWSASGPAAVSFSANGSNAARACTATFSQAGSYDITATVTDLSGLTDTDSVTVTVEAVADAVVITPSSTSVVKGAYKTFTALQVDQFGDALEEQPTFAWSVDGGGTIDEDGIFQATTLGGPFTVTADTGDMIGTASVNVTSLSLTSLDLGKVSTSGSASFSGGKWTVKGSGADIGGTADEFQFAYVKLSGEFELTARVDSISNTNASAKAGVMIREAKTAGSRNAFMCITPSNGIYFQRRTSTSGTTSRTAGPAKKAPYWVRLERDGNTVTSSYSSNGTTWHVLKVQTINLPDTVYAGLAVTSHKDGTRCTAVFSNVSLIRMPVAPN